jgi:cytochrome b561
MTLASTPAPSSAADRYTVELRALHWLMAALLVFNLTAGLMDVPKGMGGYPLHKSIGVTVLLLLAARVMVRLSRPTPALPEVMPKWEKMLAKGGVVGFYLLMLAVPLSGYLMSNSAGREVLLFGIPMPVLVEKNKELNHLMHEVHEIAANALMVFIGLHVLAVVKHLLLDRTNLLKRMV